MGGVESEYHVKQNKPSPEKINMFSPIYIIEV